VIWNGATPTTTTASDGTFVLDRGAPGFVNAAVARAQNGDLAVRVISDREPAEVLELRLVAGVEARGTVVGPDGDPVAGADVAWKRAGAVDYRPGPSPEEQVANLLRIAPWQVGFSTATDASGEFRLRSVPPGRYLVRASAPGLSASPLEVDVSPSGASATALHLTPTRTRRGHVLGRDGRPVPGAKVWAMDAAGKEPVYLALPPTWSRSDGSFVLQGVPDGPLEIRARHPRLGFGAAARSDAADLEVVLK
jgi:hypothetical protein